MSHKILKLCVDKPCNSFNFDKVTPIANVDQKNEEGFSMDRLATLLKEDVTADSYDYILIRFNDTSETPNYNIIGKLLSRNSNFLFINKLSIMWPLIFVNSKKIKEDNITVYEDWFRTGAACNLVTNGIHRINDIVCPCIILSENNLMEVEDYENMNLEHLPFGKPYDNCYIYYATKKGSMTKAIQVT